MGFRIRTILGTLGVFIVLGLFHYPLLRLPYYWDEAGYYIPAALDFYHFGQLIPSSTLTTGHTPLIIIYLALAWRAFGFSPLVTRVAMNLVAAGAIMGTYALGRRVAGREVAWWSALLLSLMPVFFAQSSLAHLDLAAGLFTLLALLALLDGQPWKFALTASCAVLSKETAVVLLPAACFFSWWNHRREASSLPRVWWLAYSAPVAVLAAWAGYYHHRTGFWTGNGEYLQYNLYSTLNPVRVFLTLLRRMYETFIGGFNWLLTAGALAGIGWARKKGACCLHPEIARAKSAEPSNSPARDTRDMNQSRTLTRFLLLAGCFTAANLVMLSAVGGAVLPRYLLPIFPPLVLTAVILIWRLPRPAARCIMAATAGCFVWAWFLNPPYPFPYEDNLSYANFVRLHEQAARFLETQPRNMRILTAWPATDELARPVLGYVRESRTVVPVEGFSRGEFKDVSPESFDCLYLYSRRWEPSGHWFQESHWMQKLQERYFQYRPQIPEEELVTRYHLRLLRSFEERRQWVRFYVKR